MIWKSYLNFILATDDRDAVPKYNNGYSDKPSRFKTHTFSNEAKAKERWLLPRKRGCWWVVGGGWQVGDWDLWSGGSKRIELRATTR